MSKLKLENEGTSSYLVFELDPNDQIDQTTLGMMTNNSFMGILPIIYTQVDQTRYFKYNIGSKVPLERYVSGVMNRHKVLTLCSSIMDTISEAEEYMIENSNFIINPKCIFVEESTGRAYLVCLPLEGLRTADFLEFFKHILFNSGIAYDSSDTGYLVEIMNYVNAPSASLAGFHEKIDLMIGKKKRAAAPELTSQFEFKKPGLPPKKISSVPSAEDKKDAVIFETQEKEGPRQIPGDPLKNKDQDENEGGFAIPGGIVLEENPKEQEEGRKPRTLFGIPLTRSDVVKTEKKQPDKSDKKSKKPRTLFGIPLTRADLEIKQAQDSEEQNKNMVNDKGVNIPPANDNDDPYNPKLEPRLVRDDGITSITITSDSFIIGRNEAMCDYVIPNKKISKRHACIEREGNRFRIKDLNSTNHTFVEGEIIDSEGVYIEHGTRISLAEEEFIFELQ